MQDFGVQGVGSKGSGVRALPLVYGLGLGSMQGLGCRVDLRSPGRISWGLGFGVFKHYNGALGVGGPDEVQVS